MVYSLSVKAVKQKLHEGADMYIAPINPPYHMLRVSMDLNIHSGSTFVCK